MMKRCSVCGETYVLSAFGDDSKARGGKRSLCKACQCRKNSSILKRNRRFLDQAKDVPCADCGIEYPPHIMDFDHLPEHDKEFGISRQYSRISLNRLAAEIAKCEVVCANCHRERTFQRASNESIPVTDEVAGLMGYTLF